MSEKVAKLIRATVYEDSSQKGPHKYKIRKADGMIVRADLNRAIYRRAKQDYRKLNSAGKSQALKLMREKRDKSRGFADRREP